MVTWRDDLERDGRAEGGFEQQDEATRILRSRIDLSALPPLSRAVTERIICASADLSYAADLVCSEPWLQMAVSALAAGAPVITDSPVVAAGLSYPAMVCKAAEPLTIRLARTAGITLAAAAVRLSVAEAGPGAVWVVGAEPAAIYEILSRDARPALVIGVPAGFLGAAEAKDALRASGVPALTNVSEKGGVVVALAGCLALLEHAAAPALSLAPDLAPGPAPAWQR
jgi:precorrin-8X/cobalt-precorrin-8 methylmutase